MKHSKLGVTLAFLLAAILFATFVATSYAQQGPVPADLGDGGGVSPTRAQLAFALALLAFSAAIIAGARTATRPHTTRRPTKIRDERGGERQ